MTAPDVRVGDKVRCVSRYEKHTVTVEGEVTEAGDGWFYLGNRYIEPARALGNHTVEVLSRAVPKVGDVVKGADLDQLPLYSVAVRRGHAGLALQKLRQGWCLVGVPGDDPVQPLPDRDYRVLYVPEDGAE